MSLQFPLRQSLWKPKGGKPTKAGTMLELERWVYQPVRVQVMLAQPGSQAREPAQTHKPVGQGHGAQCSNIHREFNRACIYHSGAIDLIWRNLVRTFADQGHLKATFSPMGNQGIHPVWGSSPTWNTMVAFESPMPQNLVQSGGHSSAKGILLERATQQKRSPFGVVAPCVTRA